MRNYLLWHLLFLLKFLKFHMTAWILRTSSCLTFLLCQLPYFLLSFQDPWPPPSFLRIPLHCSSPSYPKIHWHDTSACTSLREGFEIIEGTQFQQKVRNDLNWIFAYLLKKILVVQLWHIFTVHFFIHNPIDMPFCGNDFHVQYTQKRSLYLFFPRSVDFPKLFSMICQQNTALQGRFL